ncbi:MAG TPA: hypothetical protein VHP33_31500 [Polyangiaceae bacterium]|nr:hypothetical protein [Polyangiaceae bacterium]
MKRDQHLSPQARRVALSSVETVPQRSASSQTGWSRSNLFLGGAIALAVTLLSLRLFVHAVSVQNRSGESARVACGPFVSFGVGANESRYPKYSR